jgi:hypothetical protein
MVAHWYDAMQQSIKKKIEKKMKKKMLESRCKEMFLGFFTHKNMWGVYAPPHKVGQTSSAQEQQKPHEPHVTYHACPSIENRRGFGSVSLERRHLHIFCKVSQTIKERFMLCEVLVNSEQKKIMSIFFTKTTSLLTLDGSKLFKNFGLCVILLQRIWNTRYSTSHII